jgi:arylsulfatase A-like enzyme
MTGDHGMPFPRCKGNLYDTGARVPLVVHWPERIKSGRALQDFVSFTDLAPTFLEAAGLQPPPCMTGRSLSSLLVAGPPGQIDPERDHVIAGKERHTPCQEAPDSGGTPMRSIRTHQFFYIRNFRPDRWPAGTPNYRKAFLPGGWYGDCDNGPTKSYMVENRTKDATHENLFQLAFGKRPGEELYDLKRDPGQLKNVAGDPAYAKIRKDLSSRLMATLKATGDPRVVGGGEKFDRYPYYGGIPKKPGYQPERTK